MNSGGIVLMALVGVLVFCGLIGVMVWAYSSQSAKRRKNQVGGPKGSRTTGSTR